MTQAKRFLCLESTVWQRRTEGHGGSVQAIVANGHIDEALNLSMQGPEERTLEKQVYSQA